MRWWLALAFAGIAALTALSVAQVFTARSEAAIRERAQELVAGAAVTAAATVPQDASVEETLTRLARFGARRDLALFAFSADGSLVSSERQRGVSVRTLPNIDSLLATALAGRREVDSIDNGRVVTVALPMRRNGTAALVAVASRSDLVDALGIVRDQIVSAALWATLIGALVGLVVALLITRRLRGIARAAADIERGRFDRELQPRFHDELGGLAETIDRMRERLRESFEQLEGERDRLHQLLEQLQEGVIAVDRDLVVAFSNSRARTLLALELTPGEPLPEPWPEVSLQDAARRLFEPQASPETMRVGVDGVVYVVALLPPAPASATGVVVLTDVTEHERRERAEREFVTNAAHELRTPLAAIASAVEVLQLGAKERPAERDRFLAVVERQTGRLTRLTHALLALARAQTRAEPLVLAPVSVTELTDEVVRELPDARIDIAVAGDDLTALAHDELLHQALENLVANAAKHAPDSTITLRVARTDDDRVRIDVIDSGPGMTQTEAQRALDRFYRVRDGSAADGLADGFGLGLPIVREAVTAMGGHLELRTAPGAGTTVSIVLPAAERQRTPA
jgi:two-component system sensor histidine kinase VicK